MSGMPGMSKDDEEKPGKGLDLAIIMGGKPKPGASKARDEKPMEEEHSDELPAGFEEAFSEAFPEAAGDKGRMLALKRLIACCDSDY
jgi:hypothetical protein